MANIMFGIYTTAQCANNISADIICTLCCGINTLTNASVPRVTELRRRTRCLPAFQRALQLVAWTLFVLARVLRQGEMQQQQRTELKSCAYKLSAKHEPCTEVMMSLSKRSMRNASFTQATLHLYININMLASFQ